MGIGAVMAMGCSIGQGLSGTVDLRARRPLDTRGREVMRIMPRVNEEINEEWISDKTRFIWDGLKTQRLDRPYVRKGGRLVPTSWQEAFGAVRDAVSKVSGDRIGAIAGR